MDHTAVATEALPFKPTLLELYEVYTTAAVVRLRFIGMAAAGFMDQSAFA